MIDPERIQRLTAKLGNRNDALEFVRQMRCGGKKYDGGGKYFRTELRDESPMSYEPMMPVYPDVAVPERYYPQPNLGDYEYPESTGMIQAMPIQMNVPVSAPPTGVLADEVTVPVSDLFSDEAIARRALKQRYAESSFNDRAVSKAGAQGAWQIMPITLKDYLGRGRGKAGDLNDPEYNRKVRDWVMGIIPRDLQEFWSEDDSDINKLAKLYAAYNWGAGNLRGFLRKKQKAGVDISNPDNWVDDLNPETRRYVKYLAFDEDIPDSTAYTNSAFEKAAMERGYLRCGGEINRFETGGPENIVNPKIIGNVVKRIGLSLLPKNVSKGLASIVSMTHGDLNTPYLKDYYQYGVQEEWNPEEGFLMSPSNQRKYMESIGYHKVNDGSYGMVNKAATNLSNILGSEIPIYQLGDNDISPDEVELVSTDPSVVSPYFWRLPQDRMLRDAGSHPSALYKDRPGNYYIKSWDLNDYGQHGNRTEGTRYGIKQALAELYDYIGTPFVQRTGLIRVPTEEEIEAAHRPEFESREAMIDYVNRTGKLISEDDYAAGGKIHIKPENRGKFTALKKRTGHSASWFKAHGTPAQKKMAIFALNAKKWHHGDGGLLKNYFGDGGPEGEEEIYLGELQPSVKLAEEPLFVDTPYTANDFFKRWYPDRSEQLAGNMAKILMDRSAWPFSTKRRARKSVDGYTRSMLQNMDENLKEYSLISSIWDKAYPHNSAYDPNREWKFPDALKDEEAVRVLDEHIKAKNDVLKSYGINTNDEIDDTARRSEGWDNYGFSYSNDPYHIFYSSAWPSNGTIVHERTHTLRPLPGEYEKYSTYYGLTPMEYATQKIERWNDNLLTEAGKNKDDKSYYTSPKEIVARLNEIRFNLGLNPKRIITLDDLKEIRKRASESEREDFLDLYTDETLLRFFNEVADAGNKESLYGNHLGNISAMGGILERYDVDSIRQAIQNARARQKK